MLISDVVYSMKMNPLNRKGFMMENLTLEKAKEINATMVTEDHLILHVANVSAAMGAMARHFGERLQVEIEG